MMEKGIWERHNTSDKKACLPKNSKLLEPFECRMETDNETLVNSLREVAEKYSIDPKELQRDQYPIIEVEGRKSCLLETAEYIDRKNERALMYGNAHGLIFPFLQRAVEEGIVQLPLKAVFNVDYHADIVLYTDLYIDHTASWQKYGVEKGFWSVKNSYNWQPEKTTAPPTQDRFPDKYIQSVDTNEASHLSPEVLSIDLDFFNNMTPDTDMFDTYISILKKIIKKSKCVFVFSSSGYTKFESLSPETMRQIIQEIQIAFINEG